jgi:hypothetical protein
MSQYSLFEQQYTSAYPKSDIFSDYNFNQVIFNSSALMPSNQAKFKQMIETSFDYLTTNDSLGNYVPSYEPYSKQGHPNFGGEPTSPLFGSLQRKHSS